MSPHNIGFYEDLTKIIFQLSSNIIKYAPHLFFFGNFDGLIRAFWHICIEIVLKGETEDVCSIGVCEQIL